MKAEPTQEHRDLARWFANMFGAVGPYVVDHIETAAMAICDAEARGYERGVRAAAKIADAYGESAASYTAMVTSESIAAEIDSLLPKEPTK